MIEGVDRLEMPKRSRLSVHSDEWKGAEHDQRSISIGAVGGVLIPQCRAACA